MNKHWWQKFTSFLYSIFSNLGKPIFHQSFGNNDKNVNQEYNDESSFEVSTHDIEGFKEGHSFGNANSNFVKSEIAQNIQHSSNVDSGYDTI